MEITLAKLTNCAEIAGLRPHEMIVGAAPGDKHERMLNRYRALPPSAACRQLVSDIRAALAREANGRAADLLIVLRMLLVLPAPSAGLPRRRRLSIRRARYVWIASGSDAAQEAQGASGRETVVVKLFEGRAPARN